MKRTAKRLVLSLAGFVLAAGTFAADLSTQSRVDHVFEKWNRSDTPGCAVGVAVDGKPVLVRAYGMADLELGIRLHPGTVFESGSVAKQFTAAAVALLVQDGRISLDDPVRKYIPEMPDFGSPLRVRHLLNHTSGLRSQWSLMDLAGRPRGRAVHTNEEILELVGRMEELNFRPGDEYLYCNTGYTLLGVLIARVSGMSLDAFSRERLFGPLGMTRTQWRDDFTEIVPDRATAYGQKSDGTFFTNMPFTNVVGNGGVLTTIGDLLIWNANLDQPRVGGPAFVNQLETRGRLNDGTEIEYAQGLMVTSYKGLREVSHSGSTAGYKTFLARIPEARFSIAVLSNSSTCLPERLAREVTNIYLAGKLKEPDKPAAATVDPVIIRKYAGVYREPLTDAALRVEPDRDGRTLLVAGQAFIPLSDGEFSTPDGSRRLEFEPASEHSSTRIRDTHRASVNSSKPRIWEAVPAFSPKPAELTAYAGTYYSREIDTAYLVDVEDGRLRIRFRPAQSLELTPVYQDAFEEGNRVFRFTRSAEGRVDGFEVYAGRIRHFRFNKKGQATAYDGPGRPPTPN